MFKTALKSIIRISCIHCYEYSILCYFQYFYEYYTKFNHTYIDYIQLKTARVCIGFLLSYIKVKVLFIAIYGHNRS